MEISFDYAELRTEAEKSFLSYIKKDEKRRKEWDTAESDWKIRWKERWISEWIDGYKKGIKEASEEIAIKLFQHGYSAEIIYKSTSLSMDEIYSLKAKLQ